ncbi:MAG TPA: tetratricopeptide repeat protein [Myxococcota bacterium]|nr:tetratricopeptide repeat protein [Myxococcota bacterium]
MIRKPTHSLGRALVALLVATAASAARAADPPCVTQCHDMAAKGQLRAGLNEAGCLVNVCQEEGRRLYADGSYEAALASYAAVAAKLERSPSFLLDQGLVYYALGRFNEALANFDAILLSVPDSFQAGTQRAHTLVRVHKLGDARTQFDKLLGTPAAQREFRGLRTSSYLKGNIGVLDLLLGDTAKGKKELEDALEADGRNSLASTYIYRVLPAMESKTIDADGVYLLLTASEDVGINRRDAARDSIEKLVAKYPKFPETYFLAAVLYRNAGHYEECERLLLIGERAIPAEIDLRAERLRCTLLRVGPTSDAAKPSVADLKKLAKDHPDSELAKQILRALDIYPE